MRRLLPLAAAALLGASTVSAQMAPEKYGVGAHLGYTKFSKGAGLENAPFLGVDASYQTPWNPLEKLGLHNTDFGVGFLFAASAPLTRADQFPVVALDYGDTTFLFTVAQRITLLQEGLKASAGYHVNSNVRLYGFLGLGYYTMLLDARQNLAAKNITRQMQMFGGGADYALSETIGVRFEARAAIFTSYNRASLDPSVGYLRDTRIVDALGKPDGTWSRVWNPQMSLVFQYVPSRRGGGAGATGGQP
jgi:Outer membrane protein beta-barrel domain